MCKKYDNAHLLAGQGYAMLYPDVPMKERNPLRQLPGLVLPAVDRLIDLGIVDPDRMGVIGHSYGAYCVMALLTQTTRFRAAVCSAPTVNLTSFYGSVTEGLSHKLFWSEKGQGGLGGTRYASTMARATGPGCGRRTTSETFVSERSPG